MNDHPQPDLAAQFRELGQNLKDVFQSAWESEQAQKLKEELKEGFVEIGTATTQAIEDFSVSEAGRNLKSEAEAFKTRLESGELEAKSRQEISKALQTINTELQKIINGFSASKQDPEA